MTLYGQEQPVLLPSMGIYDTQLMRDYINDVKQQYETSQQEFKDFLKQHGDFYSDVNGQTELYNKLTVGGANDLINSLYASGIDPFKSPEARAVIRKYIWSIPIGKLNELKRSADYAVEYKKNLAKAMQDPNFDLDYNRWMFGGRDLENWDPNTPWTATAPYIAPSMKDVANPYFERFKQSEILKSDVPGYIKKGTTDENQNAAINLAIQNFENTPYGRYRRYQAEQAAAQMTDENRAPLTEEQRKREAEKIIRGQFEDYARQFFQPSYETDPYYKSKYEKNLEVWAHKQKINYDIAHPLTSSSNSRSGRANALNPQSQSYRPLYASSSAALSDIIKQNRYSLSGPGSILVPNSFKDVQDNIFLQSHKSDVPNWANVSWNATPTINQALEALTRSDDASRYATQQGRKAENGSGSTVRFEPGDETNLYSPEELAYMANYRKTKGDSDRIRANIVKSSQDAHAKGTYILKTDLGKVTVIQIGNRIKVFKPVRVDGNIMYEDTGYHLYADGDNAGEIDEDKSYGALQHDTYAAHKHYGMKEGQTAGELNM